MATTVAEIMTRDPETVQADMTVGEAARCMAALDIGVVVVLDTDRLAGILTDRDIVVRVVAADKDSSTSIREVCSGQAVATITPDTSIGQAAELMGSMAVRRLPVVRDDRVIGVVSLGDLAAQRGNTSALADISAAAPNR